MEITEIKITLNNDNIVRAYADIVIDDCFIVKGLKIIETKNIFVAMPSRRRRDGSFSEIAHPINRETKKMIDLKILEAYEKELDK